MKTQNLFKFLPYALLLALFLCGPSVRAQTQDLKVGDPAPEFLTTDDVGMSAALHLPFRLLVDPDKKIAKAYGSSGIFFASRDTFVIDGQGKIQKIYRGVNPESHAGELIKGFY